MLNILFVVSMLVKRIMFTRFINSNGDTLTVFSIQNNQNGANKLLDKLRKTLTSDDFQKLTIGMESTSVYADHLAILLRSDDFLEKTGC